MAVLDRHEARGIDLHADVAGVVQALDGEPADVDGVGHGGGDGDHVEGAALAGAGALHSGDGDRLVDGEGAEVAGVDRLHVAARGGLADGVGEGAAGGGGGRAGAGVGSARRDIGDGRSRESRSGESAGQDREQSGAEVLGSEGSEHFLISCFSFRSGPAPRRRWRRSSWSRSRKMCGSARAGDSPGTHGGEWDASSRASLDRLSFRSRAPLYAASCGSFPVIDLKGGHVVRAFRGERASYAPIVTPLAASSAPQEVVAGFLRLHDFDTIYVADLDAIERRGDHARGDLRAGARLSASLVLGRRRRRERA